MQIYKANGDTELEMLKKSEAKLMLDKILKYKISLKSVL